MTRDIRHMKDEIWRITCDTWHFIIFFFFSSSFYWCNYPFDRFSFSGTQDFSWVPSLSWIVLCSFSWIFMYLLPFSLKFRSTIFINTFSMRPSFSWTSFYSETSFLNSCPSYSLSNMFSSMCAFSSWLRKYWPTWKTMTPKNNKLKFNDAVN